MIRKGGENTDIDRKILEFRESKMKFGARLIYSGGTLELNTQSIGTEGWRGETKTLTESESVREGMRPDPTQNYPTRFSKGCLGVFEF